MLQGFQEALKEHEEQLVKDPVVHTHLSALYDTLLEQNLIRLIEPFSCVQIQHLAELISLPLDTVLNKLAQVLHPTLCDSYCLSAETPHVVPKDMMPLAGHCCISNYLQCCCITDSAVADDFG